MTDSGGVQEEAMHPGIRKYVLVLRSSTERPEAMEAGFARIVGLNPNTMLAELEKATSTRNELSDKSLFGDGRANERIVKVLKREVEKLV